MHMRTILVRPLGEGEPWLYGRHVQHVTKKRKLLWAWGKGGKIPLRQHLFDEIHAHAGETYVQPGHVGDHVRWGGGRQRSRVGKAGGGGGRRGDEGDIAMRFIFLHQMRVCSPRIPRTWQEDAFLGVSLVTQIRSTSLPKRGTAGDNTATREFYSLY